MTRTLFLVSFVALVSACAVDASRDEDEASAESSLAEPEGLSSESSVRVEAKSTRKAGAALAFDVNVIEAGDYVVSSSADDNPLHVTVDGKASADEKVTLAAGRHELAVTFDKGAAGVDTIDVVFAARPPIVMGMYNNTAIVPGAEESTPENFRAVANRWMVGSKIKVDRQFDNKIPVSYAKSAGGKDPANGNVSFLSIKPPSGDVAGVTSGRYDTQIKALAATIPAGSYFTMFHEPEDDFKTNARKFVDMFKHFYQVAKAANPRIQIGYVAMAYQWRPSGPYTQRQDDWWVGPENTDFLGVDAYNNGWQGRAYTLDEDPYFQRWYKWAKAKNKPIVLAEYGVESEGTDGFPDNVRANTIKRSIEWAWTQPQIKMILWWNGTKATPGGKDHFLNPTKSIPQDRFPLARKAWNDAVTKYGSTGTSY